MLLISMRCRSSSCDPFPCRAAFLPVLVRNLPSCTRDTSLWPLNRYCIVSVQGLGPGPGPGRSVYLPLTHNPCRLVDGIAFWDTTFLGHFCAM